MNDHTHFSTRRRRYCVLSIFALFSVLASFALAEDVTITAGGTTVSATNSNNYTFSENVSGDEPSGPLTLDLSSSGVNLSGAINVNSDALIFATGGTTNTSTLSGAITIDNTKSLTFGSESNTSDVGTINLTGSITGGQAINIQRSTASQQVVFASDNTEFKGTINVVQGNLVLSNANSSNSSISMDISANGTLTLNSASATVGTLTNNGTIALGGRSLTISSNVASLGKVSNGTIIYGQSVDADFEQTDYSSVGFQLNGGIMTISENTTLGSVSRGTIANNTSETVSIADGKTLTLTNSASFGEKVVYSAAAGNGKATVIFNATTTDTPFNLSGNFDTTSGKIVDVQVNANNKLTLGATETINNLTLADGANIYVGNYDLKLNGTTVTNAGTTTITSTNSEGTVGTGSLLLTGNTTLTGTGTLNIGELDAATKAVTISAAGTESEQAFTAALTSLSNQGAITVNENATLKMSALTVSGTYSGIGTFDGNLTFASGSTHSISGGASTVTGTAAYNTGSTILMSFTDSSSAATLIADKVVFNTNNTSAVTTDTVTTVKLTGNIAGSKTVTFITAENGIFGNSGTSATALTSTLKLTESAGTDGTNYIVSNAEGTENFYKFYVANDEGLTIDGSTLALDSDGNLTMQMKAQATSQDPTGREIEDIIINAANAGNETMSELNELINQDGVNKDSALNQISPQATSALAANNLWTLQEYNSGTFQRMRSARYGARGYMPGNTRYASMAPEASLGAMNSEVMFLAQSYQQTVGGPVMGEPVMVPDGAQGIYPMNGGYAYGAGGYQACPGAVHGGYAGCGYGVMPTQWWFRGFGGWQVQNEDRNLYGYDSNYGGFNIGFDKFLGPNFLFGFSAGAVTSDLDFNDPASSSATTDSFLLNIYGSFFDEIRYFDFIIGYQNNSSETTRNTNIAGLGPVYGDFGSSAFNASFEVGRTFRHLREMFEPFFGIQYITIDSDDYTETGAQDALAVSGIDHDAIIQTLGIRMMRSICGPNKGYVFIPQVEFAWVHDYGDSDIITTAGFAASPETGSFTTTGYAVPRDRAKFSLGLDVVFSPVSKVDLKYETQFGDGFGFHALTGTWNLSF